MRAPELNTIEVGGTTRAQFLLRGALATGALYGAGAIAPYVSNALAQTATDDVSILNFALQLEQLETAFYKAALANAGLTGRVQQYAKEFGAQEEEHVKALEDIVKELGGKTETPPPFQFGLTDQASFLDLAVKLEDTGVGAYNGAIPSLKTADLVVALGGIVQTEGRHSSALRMLANMDPAPVAFEKGLAPAEVAATLRPYVQGGASGGAGASG
jgi:rubrerythrin